MRIHLQRTIEVRAFFDGPFAVIRNHATPKNCLAFVIDSFELKPSIVGIDRASWKEVPDPLGANHNIDAHSVATADSWMHAAERCGDESGLSDFAVRNSCCSFSFFANGEGGCKFRLAGGSALQCGGF